MKCEIKQAHTATKKTKPKAQVQVTVPPKLKPIHLSEGHQQRYDRIKSAAPAGFEFVLEKIIRAVVLGRPIHVSRFIADFLDAELSHRTFNDVMYGCMLKKSLRNAPYPTESCLILGMTSTVMKDAGGEVETFPLEPVQCELEAPALDRYRELAVPEDFEFCEDTAGLFEGGNVPEYPIEAPALDRYREHSGIEEFVPDEVGDVDSGSHSQLYDLGTHHPTMPNCACTFCMLQAATAKSRNPTQEGAAGATSHLTFEPGSVPNEYVDEFMKGPLPVPFIKAPAEDRYRKYVDAFVPTQETSDKDGHYEAMFLQPGWYGIISPQPHCPDVLLHTSEFSNTSLQTASCHAPANGQAGHVSTGPRPAHSASALGGGHVESHGPTTNAIGENLTLYGDQPTYKEPSFNEERLFVEPNDAADEPFGQTFQQDPHFEDKIFEPEYSLGEKTFMQEHPEFGDFSEQDVTLLDLTAEHPELKEK